MDGILKIEAITAASFALFGKVIEFSPEPEDERFEVVIREESEPWRIAVFRVRRRAAERLECHPTSMESFEPLQGVGILLVAEPHSPDKPRAFLLGTPICLYKGVWHEVIALSKEALYKITENRNVNSEFYPFTHPVEIKVITG